MIVNTQKSNTARPKHRKWLVIALALLMKADSKFGQMRRQSYWLTYGMVLLLAGFAGWSL